METVWLLWFADTRGGVKRSFVGVFNSEKAAKKREMELIKTNKAQGLKYASDFTTYYYEVEPEGEGE